MVSPATKASPEEPDSRMFFLDPCSHGHHSHYNQRIPTTQSPISALPLEGAKTRDPLNMKSWVSVAKRRTSRRAFRAPLSNLEPSVQSQSRLLVCTTDRKPKFPLREIPTLTDGHCLSLTSSALAKPGNQHAAGDRTAKCS